MKKCVFLVGLLFLWTLGSLSCVPQQARDPRDTSNIEVKSASGWLRIISPEPAGFLPTTTVTVQARMKLTDPDIRYVEVNGKQETIRNGRISTTVELDGCDDVQSVVVWVPDTDLSANVDFYCDPERPVIYFDAPYENGVGASDGERFLVKGHIADNNLKRIFIEDPTYIRNRSKNLLFSGADNHFVIDERVQPGAQRRRICAVDRADNMMCRHLAAAVGDKLDSQSGVEIPDAIGFSVGQNALNEIANYAEKLVAARDFTAKINALNPLAKVYDSFGNILYEVNGYKSTHSGVADISVELKRGELHIVAQLYNYRSYFTISSHYIPPDNGNLFIPVVRTEFHARADVKDGKVVIDLPPPEVSICPNINQCVLSMNSNLYNSFAQLSAIKEKVRQTTMATMRSEIHKDTDLSIDKALQTELAYDFELSGYRGRVTATPASIAINANAIEIYANVGLRALDPVLQGPGTIVNFRKGRPDLDRNGKVSAGLSTDLINAAFYAAWSAGIFSQELDAPPISGEELNVGFLSALLPLPEAALPSSPIRFKTYAPLAPTLRDTGAGSVELLVPDLRVQGYARQDGDDPLLFEVSLAVRTEIALEGEGRSFKIKLYSFEIIGDPIGAPPAFPSGRDLDKILDLFLADTVKKVVEGVGRLDIPAMPLFRIDEVAPFAADGYVAFEGNLYYND
ncbi:MAG: hypothetical protein IPJ88_08700 [Myxococcales bacterium]|nr:MAG: hypothetical protein IPJ88_08700 [Myxococcales bacterium]